MQLKFFFNTSKAVASRITETFDFVHPTAAAVWNLRWQVQGLVGAYPTITESELRGRFIAGSSINGVNLKRACIDKSWEAQKEQFAKFLLFEFCSLYEGWCESIIQQAGLSINKKSLQFPSGSYKGKPTGISLVLREVQASISSVFHGCIYPSLCSNGKYSPTNLEQLLKCYRYFKELRNYLIHGHEVTTGEFSVAEQDYAALSAADLGLKEKPGFFPYSIGSSCKPELRGVIGFGEVVLKLISTLDIMLSSTIHAEPEFKRRWKAKHGAYPITLSAANVDRRNRRITVLSKGLGIPAPVVTPQFSQWLLAEGLIFF